ncbi:MAG: serine protease [Myxococcota bacterium]
MRSSLSLALVLLTAAPAFAQGDADGPTIRLRPIDEASVRIIGVGGTRLVAFDGRSGSSRIVGIPETRHGTGVVVDGQGLVATARHVIEGADFLAVIFPGETEPVATRLLYVDPFHDIALLRVERATPSFVEVPRQRAVLELSQRLSASGYPLEIRERYPAAVSGELSRQRNDGRLQLAMSVNPGNSGGPVIDDQGKLIGIISARGDTNQGVEGIAIVEQARHVATAMEAVATFPDGAAWTDQERLLARIVTALARVENDRPSYEQTALATIREAAAAVTTGEAAMMVAALAWNMHIALLEARRKRDVAMLDTADRRSAEGLLEVARDLARRARNRTPYLIRTYPIMRAITAADGRSWVPARE